MVIWRLRMVLVEGRGLSKTSQIIKMYFTKDKTFGLRYSYRAVGNPSLYKILASLHA